MRPSRPLAWLAAAFILLVTFPGDAREARAGEAPYRTVVIFGDTQSLTYHGADPALYAAYQKMIGWVIEHRESENIDLVLHTGDAIQNQMRFHKGMRIGRAIEACQVHPAQTAGECEARDARACAQAPGCFFFRGCRSCAAERELVVREWDRFNGKGDAWGWKDLEAAGIPYAIVRGNHDNLSFGDVPGFDTYYGVESMRDLPGYLASCDGCSMKKADQIRPDLAHAWRFSLGEGERARPLLVIGLSWRAGDDQISWAESLIEKHPDLPVILLSHTGFRAPGDSCVISKADDPVDTRLWERLVAHGLHGGRIDMVVQGHVACDIKGLRRVRNRYVLQVLFNRQGTIVREPRLPAAAQLGIVRFYPSDSGFEFDANTVDPLAEGVVLTNPRGGTVGRRPFPD